MIEATENPDGLIRSADLLMQSGEYKFERSAGALSALLLGWNT